MKDADCRCMTPPFSFLDFDSFDLGVDETNGRFADVTVNRCKVCGRYWLKYLVEYEAFSESGRWFRGMIEEAEVTGGSLTPETALQRIAGMEWFFYGGSYYRTTGRKSFPGMVPNPNIC
ncbi:MAG: hypothetical protein NTX50_04790 [Candidatus Sumerlaeota bacterium]|nr:hypothetical protein [Candidatus Sumerlaeota bacterium]